MSMVSFALRLAVTRLLANRTWADGRILNSPVDPTDQILANAGEQQRPMIAVYTNSEKVDDVGGRSLNGSRRQIDMMFFIYLSPSKVEVSEDGNTVVFEARDAGGAAYLDLVTRQIHAALLFGEGPWRKVYEKLVVSVREAESKPILVEWESGLRIPAQEYRVQFETVGDPDHGVAAIGGWADLLAAMQDDPAAAPLHDMVKAAIESPSDLPSWRVAQAQMALTEGAIRSLGFAPADPTETGEAAELEDVEIDGEVGPIP
ncbi:MAG: hypothetical protein EA385_15045 [Salinarimonadaceae bacterium]|nr:MAG: hypothetical protein EA385_15045 [Salinarimonadaceae bacterium]